MYIFTDIHGCFKSFQALLKKLPKGADLAFCGDLVDRGPDSAAVVRFARENNVPTVKGNHEDMMVKGLLDLTSESPSFRVGDFQLWMQNGGAMTLASYGLSVDDRRDTKAWPEALHRDLDWLAQLPTAMHFYDVKNERGQHLLLTHAAANCELTGHEIMWNRGLPDESSVHFNVFGHTPFGTYWKPNMQDPYITDFYADIDTGCAYGGRLTALGFPSMKVFQQNNVEGR